MNQVIREPRSGFKVVRDIHPLRCPVCDASVYQIAHCIDQRVETNRLLSDPDGGDRMGHWAAGDVFEFICLNDHRFLQAYMPVGEPWLGHEDD